MGLFSDQQTRSMATIMKPQQRFLQNSLIPYSQNLLDLGTGAGQQAGQIGTAGMLSLAGLENIAGGGGGQATTNASNASLQDIMKSNPLDVNDFVNSTVLEPGLREFDQRLAPELLRNFSAQGTRFGEPAARGISQLLEGVSTATNAARATAALGARQQNLAQRLAAAQIGQGAGGRDVATLATLGAAAEQMRLQALEKSLGLPIGTLAAAQQTGLSSTLGMGTSGGSMLGNALAGWLQPGGFLPSAQDITQMVGQLGQGSARIP